MRAAVGFVSSLCLCALAAQSLPANPPVASYIFPAGGRRGSVVPVRVGGLFLHGDCRFALDGPGVHGPARLKGTATRWFEGPLLPLPDSQRAEDYPRDLAGEVRIDAQAAPGVRRWRLWTSQGATPSMRFVVGELPEVVETEIDGDPVPMPVQLPVTINGRIFPRGNVDVWTFHATRGQAIRCEVHAARLGSPLDARLDVLGPDGRAIAENDDFFGADPLVGFVAQASGEYQVRIRDTQDQGGPAHVYRLTLTAGPYVEHFFPLGGRRGSKLKLRFDGPRLPAPSLDVSIPNDAAEALEVRPTPQGPALLLDVDDLPEHLESSGPITFPAVLNGCIRQGGAVDVWPWSGRKGEKLDFDLRAGRLGSRLDGVLTICDPAGKELARAEATGPGQLDPILSFTVPADGTYTVRVQDRFASRGGPAFAYRLRVTPPTAPDYRLRLAADALTLPRAGQARLKVTADRLAGFKDAIALKVDGLPAGVTVAAASIPAGQAAAELTFKADASAKIQPCRITVHGEAKAGDRVLSRPARLSVPRGEPEVGDVLLAVALPTPFVIKGEYDMGFAARGSTHRRRYKIIRKGYDGPIEVSLADRQARHLQGVTGPTIVVPPGQDEFTYAAFLPPWMETGRTCRVCVMGVGVVKEPDGSLHRVSFSSVNQNEQLVAVVGPGKLALELPQTSFTARPGATVPITVRVKRGVGIPGPVTVELVVPAHVRGISAAPVMVAPDRDEGTVFVRCDRALRGPWNMPPVVRATLMHDGAPLTAEAKVDIRP